VDAVISFMLSNMTSSLRSAIVVHYSYNLAPAHIKSFLTFPETAR
jgi:hypothetical protein